MSMKAVVDATGNVLRFMTSFYGIVWLSICAVSGFCLQYFWVNFSRIDTKINKGARWLPGMLYFSLTGMWHMAGLFTTQIAYKFFFLLAVTAAVFGLCCMMMRGMLYSNLYFFVTFFSVNGLSYLIAFSTISALYGVEVFPGRGGVQPAATPLLLFGLSFCGLLMFSSWRLVKGCGNIYHDLHLKEIPFALLPGLTGLLFHAISNGFLLTPKGDKIMNSYLIGRVPILGILLPICSLLCLLTILFTNKLLQKLLRQSEEKSERVILSNQIKQMQECLGQVEQFYEDIRSMKHEMRNHLCSIQGLACLDKSKEMSNAYITQLNDSLNALNFQYPTGNPVTDVVINSKLRLASEMGISCSCTFYFPENLGISAYDISIILNNGLDNALEACQRLLPSQSAYIYVKSVCKGRVFMLCIENSFDGRALTLSWDQLPQTTKSNKEEHGIGLRNIRKCAQKYGGDIECQPQGDRFILSVLLQGGHNAQAAQANTSHDKAHNIE